MCCQEHHIHNVNEGSSSFGDKGDHEKEAIKALNMIRMEDDMTRCKSQKGKSAQLAVISRCEANTRADISKKEALAMEVKTEKREPKITIGLGSQEGEGHGGGSIGGVRGEYEYGVCDAEGFVEGDGDAGRENPTFITSRVRPWTREVIRIGQPQTHGDWLQV